MPLPKISEARDLDDQALETAIADTRKRLFDLRFQQATRQLEGGLHQFKHERHRLAQLMTVLRERQIPESSDGDATEPPAEAVAQASMAEVAQEDDSAVASDDASDLAADETSATESAAEEE